MLVLDGFDNEMKMRGHQFWFTVWFRSDHEFVKFWNAIWEPEFETEFLDERARFRYVAGSCEDIDGVRLPVSYPSKVTFRAYFTGFAPSQD